MPEQIPLIFEPCYGFRKIEEPKSRLYTEAQKEAQMAYYKSNKARISKRKKVYAEAHKGARTQVQRAWREANPEKVLNGVIKYTTDLVGTLTYGLIPKLLESQKWTCIVCNKDLRLGYHVDHIVPVSKGGENIDGNVQILCPKCNLSKGNKDFAEFLKDRGLDPSNYRGVFNPSERPTLEEA